MLKDIGERPEHQHVITQCKQISSWLHNHGQLNAIMRSAIGGEFFRKKHGDFSSELAQQMAMDPKTSLGKVFCRTSNFSCIGIYCLHIVLHMQRPGG
jgi:hypothetical protein